jgi:hypothetical protein
VTSVDGIDICEGDFDDPGLCACNDWRTARRVFMIFV